MRSRIRADDAKRKIDTPAAHGRHVVARVSVGSASSVTELQQTAGNQAVRRILPRVGRAPVVQRDTKKVTYGESLDTASSRSTYVAHAVKLWQTNKAMKLTPFAEDLTQVIGTELTKYGIPPPKMVPDSKIGGLGEFNQELWVMKVNIARFGKAGAQTLGDLSPAEVEEAVGTLYHEARHADQNVLVVRSLLAKKQSVDRIVAVTKIRKDVVEHVRTTKFADALDPAKVERAGRMYDVMYGEHKELLTFLAKEAPAVTGIEELAKPGSDLKAATSHVKVFAEWHAKVLTPKIAKLGAKPKRSAVEDVLLGDLKGIDVAAKDFLKEWNVTSAAKSPYPDDIELVREVAATLETSLAKAYRNLESEKDAFRVEAPVKSAFGTQAAAAKRP